MVEPTNDCILSVLMWSDVADAGQRLPTSEVRPLRLLVAKRASDFDPLGSTIWMTPDSGS